MTMAANEIEIINIEKELTRLWDQELGQNKTRASLFNLIIYVPQGQRIKLFDSIVDNVVNKFPCRVLMISSEERGNSDKLQTAVSSHTIGSIYCEIIRIEVAGKYKERVPFLVIPNIQADLPVYMLWTQDPLSDNPIFPKLARISNRIIFDAESTANLQKYSQKLLEVKKNFSADVGDLNWSALAPWRKLLAETYNDAKMLEHLREASDIRITYNKKVSPLHPHTEIEAAYLQAWIASRMQWKLKSQLTYMNEKDKVKVAIETASVDLPAGAIVSLEIVSKKSGGHLICTRDPNSCQVHVQFSDNEKCQLPVCHILTGAEEGQEIINEIFYPASMEHFCSALTMLSNTKWK
ncbi:MAG: hypothetical protein S4CHLAM81_04340 [Chlamydiales bacterium]|nr:hypothetical protein [Chlamydiales bacterium]MCH9635223.1 hypothetical protein [Chlamydiales bacterium]